MGGPHTHTHTQDRAHQVMRRRHDDEQQNSCRFFKTPDRGDATPPPLVVADKYQGVGARGETHVIKKCKHLLGSGRRGGSRVDGRMGTEERWRVRKRKNKKSSAEGPEATPSLLKSSHSLPWQHYVCVQS